MPARPMVFAVEYIHLLHSGHPSSVLPAILMEIHFLYGNDCIDMMMTTNLMLMIIIIMSTNNDLSKHSSSLPLFPSNITRYAHYDNNPSFSDYSAFGGWSRYNNFFFYNHELSVSSSQLLSSSLLSFIFYFVICIYVHLYMSMYISVLTLSSTVVT